MLTEIWFSNKLIKTLLSLESPFASTLNTCEEEQSDPHASEQLACKGSDSLEICQLKKQLFVFFSNI